VPISRQNPFSTSKADARLPLRYLGFLVCIDCLQATVAGAGNGEGRLDGRTSMLIVVLPTEIA